MRTKAGAGYDPVMDAPIADSADTNAGRPPSGTVALLTIIAARAKNPDGAPLHK